MVAIKIINFSVAALEKLSSPEKGYDTYKDAKNIYLYLYVTANGIKTFFVRKRIHGRDERIIIGRFPIFSIEEARKRALEYLRMVADGKHPHEEKKKQALSRKNFGDHFYEYIERYCKKHKKTWSEDKREIEKYVPHWFKRDLSEIKKSDVQRLHEKIGEENGRPQANIILYRLQGIYRLAIEWGWEGVNPTVGIKKFKEYSRDRFVQPEELPHLLRTLNELPSETHRDYFSMLFLTGARKTNVRMMQWQEINWEQSVWRIPVTKNGDPLIVPLIPRAMDILRKRFGQSKSKWVFAHDQKKENCIFDPKHMWKEILVQATIYRWEAHETSSAWMQKIEGELEQHIPCKKKIKMIRNRAEKENVNLPATLLDIRLHDIRRTFASYQVMTGASLVTIGKSLGHRSMDATKVYARQNIDGIRSSIEKATEIMFSKN